MKKGQIDRLSVICRSLLRTKRACSISRLLLMAELWEGPLSSLALERRMKAYGLTNPRVLLNGGGEGLVKRLELPDGIYWELSEHGRIVLTETVESMYKNETRSPRIDGLPCSGTDKACEQGEQRELDLGLE